MKLKVVKKDTGSANTAWQLVAETQAAVPAALSSFSASQLEITFQPGLGASAQFYRHGYNSWSATNWWYLNQRPWRVWDNPARTLTAEDASTDTSDFHQSYLLTAITLDPEHCLLVGSLAGKTARFQISSAGIFATSLDGKFPQAGSSRHNQECVFTGIPILQETLAPADSAAEDLDKNSSSPELQWWIGIGTEREVFSQYAQALRDSLPFQAARPENPGAVWSSWYSWFEEVSAEKIQAEITPAAQNGYRVIQIDDGWEEKIGHWQANPDFPEGMAALAQEIQASGLIPGLWLAPFIATADAPIVHEHPEYFVHQENGQLQAAGYNWGQYYYALDTSHPGAQEWLKSLLQVVRAWGYRYLKLDFLNAAATPGIRYQNIDREEAYRIGVQIMREQAPDCYLLGSGAVIAPSLGYLDGIRVGPDTAPYWDNSDRKLDPTGPALRNALRNALARFWVKELIDPDPDVAFVRTHGSLLSPEVNQVSHDLARVCGVFACSDPDAWLLPEQRKLVTKLCQEFSPGSALAPVITPLSRYRFRINQREVDFAPWINPQGRISDRLLVK